MIISPTFRRTRHLIRPTSTEQYRRSFQENKFIIFRPTLRIIITLYVEINLMERHKIQSPPSLNSSEYYLTPLTIML